MKNLGFNVFGREAMEGFLEKHNLQDLQQAKDYYISIDDAEEIEVLRHDLFGKLKNKSSFGCVGRTANYWYLCDYFGDSTYKVRAQIVIDGNEEYINEIERKLGKRTFRNTEGFIRWITTIINEERQYNNGNVDVKVIKGKTTENVSMDSQQLQSGDNPNPRTSDEQSSTYNEESPIETFTTPQGEVFGFVDKEGNIYLDETKITPEHPIHEDGNEEFINAFEREIRGETYRSPEDFNRRLEAFKSSQGQHYNGGSDVKVRVTAAKNVGMAGSEIQSSQDAPTRTSDGHGSVYNAKHQIETFTTPQGEVFGFVDKEGLEYLQEGQEGFLCKAKIDITGLSGEQINEIKNNYEDDRGNNEATKWLEHWIERNGYSERYLNSDSIDAEDRKSATDNAGLDIQAQEGKSVRGQGVKNSPEDFGTGQIKTGFDGTNGPRYISGEGVEYFLTPQGEVFGFVDKEGNIYLDETKITPEHPIHEYTLLWDRALQQRNPELWNRGVELMKQTSLWKELHRTHTRSIT